MVDVTATFKDILREKEAEMEEVEIQPNLDSDLEPNEAELEYYNEDLIKTLIKISNEIDKLRVQIEKLAQRRKGSPSNDAVMMSLSASLKKSYENLNSFNDLIESHKNAQSPSAQLRSRNFFDYLNAIVQILLNKFNHVSALFAAEKHYLTSSYIPRPEILPSPPSSSSSSTLSASNPQKQTSKMADGDDKKMKGVKKGDDDDDYDGNDDGKDNDADDGKDEKVPLITKRGIIFEEDDNNNNNEEEEEDDAQERREFAMENRAFVVRMGNENKEALRGIERQMAEISEMQRIIAVKVMEQADDIDLIHRQAERTEREIKEGNDILRNVTAKKPKKKWYEACDCNACMVNTFFILGTLLLFLNWIHF